MTARDLKILATAYACRPDSGSEDGNGWYLAQQLTRFGDVWVLTPSHNRRAIEAAARPDRVEFVYVDVPGWPADSAAANRARRTHYNAWQMRIVPTARRLHRDLDFDVVHHLTYAQYWTGSWMGRLRIPFVWGPVGGGESAPASVIARLPPAGQRFERKRDLARWVGRRSPAVRSAVRGATLVLATTEQSRRAIESLSPPHARRSSKVSVLSNCALPEDDLTRLASSDGQSSTFQVVCVGRLEHWKGFHFAIQAFSRLLTGVPEAELHVVGTGPAEDYLRTLAHSLGLDGRVHFTGRIPRSDVLARLAASHVLVHPSLHDSSGWATLEGAAAGLPIVCLDTGGPALQVTAETGFKIPLDDADQIVARIANALTTLARNPQQAVAMGAAGRRRVEASFTWDRIGDQLASMAPYSMARRSPQLVSAHE